MKALRILEVGICLYYITGNDVLPSFNRLQLASSAWLVVL